MPNDCAVCYVTDLNFLLPTLVSAASLRKFVSSDKADVLIFLIDEPGRVEQLNRFLRPFHIEIVLFESRTFGEFDFEKFYKSHVSTAAVGRLFLDKALPETCKRIVYMDGDTLVIRDPSPLIEAVVPEGKFAAAEDMISFRYSNLTVRGRIKMPYLAGIGVHPPTTGYLNSGVFATSRQTWRAVAADAFKFFADNTAACQHYDQSALNATIGDRRLRLSLKWNFQTPFRYLGIEDYLSPSIYHFHSYPKPWMGPCEPWKDVYEPYQLALEPFKELALPIAKLDQATLEAYNKQNWRKKLLMRSPLVAKLALMHLGIDAYEKKVWL
jgi:lipopolysaccharide biosynthesis glycosyltransferase